MRAEKRRTGRIMLTVPLEVVGKDTQGVPFRQEARTVALNRHGARIQISRPLYIGQFLRITNLIGKREAEFRVVGPVAPPTERGGEWGVECVDTTQNIWGIHFPPLSESEAEEARALLECRRCHTVSLRPLSLVEVEVLQTSGIVNKKCDNCAADTAWGYSERQVAMGYPEGSLSEQQAPEDAAKQRRHARTCLQLPVRIRDYYGGVEITKTENVSKGGFCFTSDRNYQVGEGVLAVCPYSTSSLNIEMRARIVRQQEVKHTNRKIYGVRYDLQNP